MTNTAQIDSCAYRLKYRDFGYEGQISGLLVRVFPQYYYASITPISHTSSQFSLYLVQKYQIGLIAVIRSFLVKRGYTLSTK